ncbi:hypothetical protein B0H21DRAFT_889945 [Amylocystis lapponica]|nr:hypothetical protein B0H21DRAFT_889945 [Amylocystis lapponica]
MSYQEWTALFAGAPNLGRLRLMPSGFLTVPEEAGHHHTLVAALTNERPEDHTLFCPQLVFLSVNAAPLKEQWLVQQLATCCMENSSLPNPWLCLNVPCPLSNAAGSHMTGRRRGFIGRSNMKSWWLSTSWT